MSQRNLARLLAIVSLAVVLQTAADPMLTTLATFNGVNGANPFGDLIIDAGGNLYGTTSAGGTSDNGTVFQLAANTHALSTLATFNGANGGYPAGGLISDPFGNLFGTTAIGGAKGDGTVFQVAANTRALTTLATFNGINGQFPHGGLYADARGNLYGTTNMGGSANLGILFQISAATRALTTLVTFDHTTGSHPLCTLIADAVGNLYGTAYSDGPGRDGTVFKVDVKTLAVTTLASFDGSSGGFPRGSLVADSDGNLYGTTSFSGPFDGGSVFAINGKTHVLTTLATFNPTSGRNPYGTLLIDAAGNLFGTTHDGGANNDGTIFEVAANSGAITTLANFQSANMVSSEASLVADAAGNLYGVTDQGGASGVGTIFELTGSGFKTTVASSIPLPSTFWMTAVGGLLLLAHTYVLKPLYQKS